MYAIKTNHIKFCIGVSLLIVSNVGKLVYLSVG